LNRELRRRGLHIAYVPFYLPTSHPRYSAPDEEVYREIVGMLPLVNPEFDESWVKEHFVFHAPYAQAVCTTGFAELIPEHRSPIRGLYVSDSAQFYPEDRTLSKAIEEGRRAARFAIEDRA
jgi:protoporphyrinogen oxidase